MMQSALNRLQTSAGEKHGSRFFDGDRYPRQAPDVDETQGMGRPSRAGIGRKAAVAAGRIVVATAVRPLILIPVRDQLIRTAGGRCIGSQRRRDARSSSPRFPSSIALPRPQPFGIECSRVGTALPVGWRVASHTSRLALQIRVALFSSRYRSEPTRVNPCACKPSGPAHRQRLSCVSRYDVQPSERKNGTVLYQRGEFLDHHGAPQHECG